MKLKSLLISCLAALILGSASGCNFFRKSKRPKPNPHIAAEVETGFRQRWVDRRATELTTAGTDAAAAQEQAAAEFREKFPHLRIGGK